MTLEDLEATLDPIQRELEKYRESVPDEFHRGMVIIALNFAQNGYPEEALYKLLTIPRSYFLGPGLAHLETSPEFFQAANKLYRLLDEAGLGPVEYANILKPAGGVN